VEVLVVAITLGQAVARIQEDLGFITGQGGVIQARIVESQEELERGKTLPYWFRVRQGLVTVLAGQASTPLPTNFLRVDETSNLYFEDAPGSGKLRFLRWITDWDTEGAKIYSGGKRAAPQVAFIGAGQFLFVNPVDRDYTFTLSYYVRGDTLTDLAQTNIWLSESCLTLWLLGQAGLSMAQSKREKEAAAIFTDMRLRGRSASFGETLYREESQGPLYLGSEL
jgi:hypothetical protein